MDKKEYIERGALLDKLKELKEEWGFTFTADGVEEAIFAVEEEPAADVVEVRHGYWKNYGAFCVCSVCEESNPRTKPYCPNCGARMDGERKEQSDGN